MDTQFPGLPQINEERKLGFRPESVACFLHDRKLLFVSKRAYGVWLLPQETINNSEDPRDALIRGMVNELGEDFVSKCNPDFIYLGEDKAEFGPKKQGLEDLKTDEGAVVTMKGKKYYFYAIKTDFGDLDLTKTKFDDYVWLEQDPALFIANRIQQPSKKVVTLKVLEMLKSRELI